MVLYYLFLLYFCDLAEGELAEILLQPLKGNLACRSPGDPAGFAFSGLQSLFLCSVVELRIANK